MGLQGYQDSTKAGASSPLRASAFHSKVLLGAGHENEIEAVRADEVRYPSMFSLSFVAGPSWQKYEGGGEFSYVALPTRLQRATNLHLNRQRRRILSSIATRRGPYLLARGPASIIHCTKLYILAAATEITVLQRKVSRGRSGRRPLVVLPWRNDEGFLTEHQCLVKMGCRTIAYGVVDGDSLKTGKRP